MSRPQHDSQAWRDLRNAMLIEVVQGTHEVPTDEELIALLPEFKVIYRNQGG